MGLFGSLEVEDKKTTELDQVIKGSLFHSIEYELSAIVDKIKNINTLNEIEMKNIIIRQHKMILNYDLFLESDDTRRQALILFTNKNFISCFLNVIRLLDLDNHEIVCINKLAYDYYRLPNNDREIADMLYRLTTEVNGKQVIVLSGVIGINSAQILSMIRNSTFKDEKAVHRVNTYLIKSVQDLSVQQIISIICYLFDRFTVPFIYTMMEAKPSNLTPNQNKKFDNISIAILELLNSLPSTDIKKVLMDYAYTLTLVKNNTVVRFSIKSAISYSRIINVINDIESSTDLIIP